MAVAALISGLLTPPLLAAPAHAGESSTSVTKAAPKTGQIASPDSVQSAMITAMAQAGATGKPVAVDAATDPENTLTALPNGRYRRTTSTSPVRTKVNGSWAPLDPTLHQNHDGTWSPSATTATLTLSGGGSAGSTLVAMDDVGEKLSFTWPTALPAPTVHGDTALYADVLPDVDLQLQANETGGFTDLLIVKNAAAARNPALTRLRLGTVTSPGLTVSTDDSGAIKATDPAGRTFYQAPPPSMYDNADPDGAPRPGGRPAAVKVSVDSDSLTLTPDQALLTKPDAVFPMVIDPSIAAQWMPGTAVTNGNYDEIQAGCPGSPNWNTTASSESNGLGVGYNGDTSSNSCTGAERALYEFNMGSNFPNLIIADATFTVGETYIAWYSCTGNPSATSTVSLYSTGRMGTGTTWNNFNGQGTWLDDTQVGGANRTGCPGESYWQFDATKPAQATTDGFITLELRANESSSYANYFKRFDKHGTLSYDYDTTPNQPTGATTSPTPTSGQGCTTGNTQAGWIAHNGSGGAITLSAVVSDPDKGQQVQGQFALFDNSNNNAALITVAQDTGNTGGLTSTNDNGSGGGIASGGTAVKSIPTSVLTGGHTYGWYVRAWDGVDFSTNSPTCYFKYDGSGPTGLSVNGASLTGGQCVNGGTLTQGTPATASFSATDSVSGVDHFAYAWQDGSSLAAGGGTHLPFTGGLGTATASLNFTPASWGSYTLWVNATDKAGTQSTDGCYTFNVTASATRTATPGDIDGDGHPDVLAADSAGNLTILPTTGTGGATQISDKANGPNADGSWTKALVTHRLPFIAPSGTYTVDDIWALSSDRSNLYMYSNPLNRPHAVLPVVFTSSQRGTGMPPCDNSATPCNGHPLDWSQVNQLLAVGTVPGQANSGLVTEEAGGKLWFFPGNTFQSLNSPQLLTPANPAFDNWTFIAPGNGQLWARDNASGLLWSWPLTTTGGVTTLGAQSQIGSGYPASVYPQVLSLGDLNGDGQPDLVATTGHGGMVEQSNTGTATAQFDGTATPGQLQPSAWASTVTAIDGNLPPSQPSGPFTLSLTGVNGPLCLDAYQGYLTNGTIADSWTCNGSPAQQWTLHPDGSIHVTAPNKTAGDANGYCLDAVNSGTANGTLVQVYQCNGTNAQKWQLLPTGQISMVNGGRCLADPSANPRPGTQLMLWDCYAGDAEQTWTLPGTGPVNHWPLNESAGPVAHDTVAADDATAAGGAAFNAAGPTLPNGVGTSGVSLDGSTGVLNANNSAVDTTHGFTVSAWAKVNALGTADQWVVGQGTPFNLGYHGTDKTWSLVTASGTTSPSVKGPAAVAGTWTHLTVTYDGSTFTLYVNGVSAGTVTDTASPFSTKTLTIGAGTASSGSTAGWFGGSVADVQDYDTPLTSRQVMNVYDTGSTAT